MKRFVLPLTVVISLLLSVIVAPTALAKKDIKFDMNDRIDTTGTGASGDGKVNVKKDGSMDLEIKAKDLQSDTNYEVVVVIGPDGDLSFNPATVLRFPVTTDKKGKLKKFKIKKFNLELAPGTYRFDFLVMPPGADPLVGPYILACDPETIATIKKAHGTITVLFGEPEGAPRSHPHRRVIDNPGPIKEGTTVHFDLATGAFHQAIIYEKGITDDEINVPTSGPFVNTGTDAGPPSGALDPNNDPLPEGVIAAGKFKSDLVYTFDEKGDYLVICNIRGHFTFGQMFIYVTVVR